MRRATVFLTVLIAMTALAILISFSVAQQRSKIEDATIASLPDQVRSAIDRATRVYAEPLAGVQWSRVNVLSGTHHPIYQLQGMNERANKVEMEVTSAGRILEVEEHGIPIVDVPGIVTDALKGHLPDFAPTSCEAVYQGESPQPASFGFEGEHAGKKIEMYVAADGTVLNRGRGQR